VDRQVNSTADTYSSKLLKLIPAEVSAAYLAINSLVSAEAGFDRTMQLSMLVLAILCPFYLWKLGNVTSWLQIAFTTLSFPLWALNISASRLATLNLDWLTPTGLGVALILVTATIPLVPTVAQLPSKAEGAPGAGNG